MTLYLYGQSALDVMRYVRSTNNGDVPGRLTRTRRLAGAVNSNRMLDEMPHAAELMLSHVRGRVHVLVSDDDLRTSTPRLVTHLHRGSLPSNAYLDLGNDVYLPTPQYLFLQLATELDEVRLAFVGLELCGFYSVWRQRSFTPGVKLNEEQANTTYDLHAALTKHQLEHFLLHASGERGIACARRALQYVLDSAASPMESAVYLLLCLPRRLGGYGFPKPILNAQVVVTTGATTRVRYPDLYWAQRAADVEYQSDLVHSGDWYRYRDSRREVELIAEKITVLPLTRQQVVDQIAFDAFATSLRRSLGRRARTLDLSWQFRNNELRDMLLHGW